MMRRLLLLALLALAAFGVTAVVATAGGGGGGNGRGDDKGASKVKHIVVIYEENHSFDNLYGGWEGVNGPSNADAAHTTQVNQANVPFQCLLQDDINLQAQSAANPAAPLTATCNDTTTATPFPSHFGNAPFTIDGFIGAHGHDVPADPARRLQQPERVHEGHGLAGRLHPRPRAPLLPGAVPAQRRPAEPLHARQRRGRAHDGRLRHEGSSRSTGTCTSRGTRSTRSLDDFFQAAFGGSFLNHQWLIAAASPVCNAANGCPAGATHSVLDANGFPEQLPAGLQAARDRRAYVSPTRRLRRRAADTGVRPRDDDRGPRMRRLRRQHDAARVQPLRGLGPQLPPQTEPDDRRRSGREGHRLGVVRRRLVERRR